MHVFTGGGGFDWWQEQILRWFSWEMIEYGFGQVEYA